MRKYDRRRRALSVLSILSPDGGIAAAAAHWQWSTLVPDRPRSRNRRLLRRGDPAAGAERGLVVRGVSAAVWGAWIPSADAAGSSSLEQRDRSPTSLLLFLGSGHSIQRACVLPLQAKAVVTLGSRCRRRTAQPWVRLALFNWTGEPPFARAFGGGAGAPKCAVVPGAEASFDGLPVGDGQARLGFHHLQRRECAMTVCLRINV
jgi:hypothetical protein